MSLKHFHIFFINASLLLSFGFATWCFTVAAAQDGQVLMGVLAAALGVGLIIYQVWFLKMRKAIETDS